MQTSAYFTSKVYTKRHWGGVRRPRIAISDIRDVSYFNSLKSQSSKYCTYVRLTHWRETLKKLYHLNKGSRHREL
jgi:hypothetical protein